MEQLQLWDWAGELHCGAAPWKQRAALDRLHKESASSRSPLQAQAQEKENERPCKTWAQMLMAALLLMVKVEQARCPSWMGDNRLACPRGDERSS